MKHPRPALYGAVRSWGYPVVGNASGTDTQTLNLPLIEDVSRFTMISFNVGPFCDSKQAIIDQWRTLNPKMKILSYSLYGDVFDFQTPNTFYYDLSNGAYSLDPQGHLFDSLGNIYSVGYRANIGNPALMDIWINTWWTKAVRDRRFDGHFLDFAALDIAWTSGNPNILDYTRAGFSSLADLDDHRKSETTRFLQYMRSRDPNQVFVANGTTIVSYKMANFDGDLFEGWPSAQGGIDAAFTAVQAQSPKDYNIIKVENFSPYLGADNLKWMRYGLASSCMLDTYFFYGPDRTIDQQAVQYHQWWYDEYSVFTDGARLGIPDPTGSQVEWLGEPLGAATKIGTIWHREFENGYVLFNVGSKAALADTGVNFKKIRGTQDFVLNNGDIGSRFMVSAGDALFLVRLSKRPIARRKRKSR